MPAEQQINPKLSCGDGSPVRRFAGDKRRDSFRCDAFDLAACGTGNHSNMAGNFRSSGDLFHWSTSNSFQPTCKLACKNIPCRTSTQERSFFLKERFGILNSQGADEQDIVANFRMQIERKMHAINSDVVIECGFKLS